MANRLKTLQRSSDYQKIRRGGLKASTSSWLTVAYLENSEEFFRYGWTLTRKVGNSVTRNRLKRWSREFFRSKSEQLQTVSLDVNLIFRPMSDSFYAKLSHKEFNEVLGRSLQKVLKISGNSP